MWHFCDYFVTFLGTFVTLSVTCDTLTFDTLWHWDFCDTFLLCGTFVTLCDCSCDTLWHFRKINCDTYCNALWHLWQFVALCDIFLKFSVTLYHFLWHFVTLFDTLRHWVCVVSGSDNDISQSDLEKRVSNVLGHSLCYPYSRLTHVYLCCGEV